MKYNIGDRVRIVEIGNPDDSFLNGCEGVIIGFWGAFIDVHLDNDDMNLHESDEYMHKYVIVFETEIEKI